MPKKDWSIQEIERMYNKLRPQAARNQGKTLLLADPDDNSRLLLSAQLQHKGFDVITAEDSLKALRRIKIAAPDCCVLDMSLQPVGGLDILETLSRDDAYNNMLVFLVANTINREERQIARIYGAHGMHKKPVQPAVLAKNIADIFMQRQS